MDSSCGIVPWLVELSMSAELKFCRRLDACATSDE